MFLASKTPRSIPSRIPGEIHQSVNGNLLFSVESPLIRQEWGKKQFSVYSFVEKVISVKWSIRQEWIQKMAGIIHPAESRPGSIRESQAIDRCTVHTLWRTHSQVLINYISQGLCPDCKMHRTTYIHSRNCIHFCERKLKTMKIYVHRNCFWSMKNSLCACCRGVCSHWTRILMESSKCKMLCSNRLCEYEYPMRSRLRFHIFCISFLPVPSADPH